MRRQGKRRSGLHPFSEKEGLGVHSSSATHSRDELGTSTSPCVKEGRWERAGREDERTEEGKGAEKGQRGERGKRGEE